MEDLFPAMPCHDGWAACLVDGDEISPDTVTDSAGRPLPSDMRVGWFDLAATSAFDPFHGLSDYTGELPSSGGSGAVDALLDGENPPEATDGEEDSGGEAIAEVAADEAAQAEAERAEQERIEAEREAERLDEQATAAEAEARRLDQDRIAREAAAKAAAERAASAQDAESRKAAEAEARRLEQEAREAAQKAAAEKAAAERAAADRAAAEKAAAEKAEQQRLAAEAAAKAAADREAAEKAAAEAAAKGTDPEGGEGGDGVAIADIDKKDPAGASADCSNLVQLEPAALMGKLSTAQSGCLEKSLGSAGTQTQKDKISRVLLSNAEASGNKKEWERLMRRHLEEIDRSDPNLCFKYALHLSRGGVGRAWGAIKWADYALENKTQWSGTTYKTRVYQLYQLKAEASMKLWQDANNKLVEAGGDNREELAAQEEKMRGQAKDFAREWLDYARASGQDTKKPMALCVSAAGSKKYCEGG